MIGLAALRLPRRQGDVHDEPDDEWRWSQKTSQKWGLQRSRAHNHLPSAVRLGLNWSWKS